MTWQLRRATACARRSKTASSDLDGFYTFCIGTADGFAVVRDPIACKHAVLAETDDWVAMATEYRAIAQLPGAETARDLGAGAADHLYLGRPRRDRQSICRTGRARPQLSACIASARHQ